MFAPLIFGVLLRAHQLPKVSIELRGVRLENAAMPLAKVLGMEFLEIGPTLKDHVILLRTKNVEPEVLKSNLAKVLNGTWEHRKEGWRFTQTDEQKVAERKIYDKARYKFFSEMTEKSKKKISEFKPFDEASCKQIINELKNISSTKFNRNNNSIWRRIEKIDQQSPMGRFAFRAALRITPEMWMKLTEDNPRIVFCTRPTEMQQPFPFRVDDLLAQTVQEQNLWSTYAGGEPLRGPRAGNDDEESYYYLGNLNEHRQPFLTKDLDTVTMTIELNSESIEFNAYDAKGKSTFNSNINFYEYSDEDYNYDFRAEFEKMKKKMVKVEGEAAEYLDAVSPINLYGRRDSLKKSLSPGLLAKLLNPEKIDPLSIAAPYVYLTSIETPNVIMVMNDEQRMSRFPEFKESRYLRYRPANIVDADGWFLLSQPNPIASRKQMPDRKKLGPMMRFMNANKRPLNIEEQATFALQLPWNTDNSYAYQSHLNLISNTEVESYNNRSALRVYGALTPGNRDQARKGGVPFSALSDEAKQEMFRSIFYSQKYETRVEMDYQAMTQMTPNQQRDFQEMQNLMYGGVYEEKTFVLPKGLTNSLVLTIEDRTSSKLYCGRPEPTGEDDYYGSGRSMSAAEVGDHMFKLTNPQRYRYELQSYNKIDENNIRTASQRMLTLKLKLSNLLYLSWNLSQTLITDPTVYTVKSLPQGILDEIKRGYDQAEKNDKQNGQYYGQGVPRRTNPPPR